jgi:hypothetical protein
MLTNALSTLRADAIRLIFFATETLAWGRNHSPLVSSLALPAFAANTAGLEKDHGQSQAGVSATMALPATNRVLQQQKPLKIFKAKTGQAKIGGRAFRANHWSSPASDT